MANKRQMFMLEYSVRCSPGILFDFFSSATGFKEWFAEKVIERDNVYTFTWNGVNESAEMVELEPARRIRFKWLHNKNANEFFEFSIDKTDISNQTILTITDYADANEVNDARVLWEHQIKDLFHRIGI